MISRSIRQLLSFVLMAALFFVLLYVETGVLFKVFTAALVFSMILLLGLADETLKRIEKRKF